MGISKLGYVRSNPKLAFVRVTPDGVSSDIYKNESGDEWVVAHNVHALFDGKEYGADYYIEQIQYTVPMTLACYKYTKDGHDQIFTSGSVITNPSVGGNYGWNGDYPIYAILCNLTSTVDGSIFIDSAPSILLLEGWDNMGNEGEDIKAIRDLIDEYGITLVPGGGGGNQVITLSDIRCIFRMFDNVDGNQEQHQGSGATGYEQNTKTFFSGNMLDLRINNASAIHNGGRLVIGIGENVLVEIIGGQNNFGVDYGMAGEDLTQLKSQLVTILNNAMQFGEPLNGVLTLASPSSDNLPDWVQIHLEGINDTIWVDSYGQSYWADAFRSLQQGNNGWGYVIDRLGFSLDNKQYRGLYGQPPTIEAFNGSVAMKDNNGNIVNFFQKIDNSTEAYYIDNHTIDLSFATGEQDIYAILGRVTIDSIEYFVCILSNENEKQTIIDFWTQQVGGVVDEQVKVWQANGINMDYTYVGPGTEPDDNDPYSRWQRQRNHFENGAVDESWNELMDTPYDGKEAPTVHKEVKKL